MMNTNQKNTLIHDYVDEIQHYSGSILVKLKHFTEQYSEQWGLLDEGFVIDLLDDTTLTADDMVEALHTLVDMDEGNRRFVNAVTAMELVVKRERQANIIDIDAQALEKEATALMPKVATPLPGLSQGLESFA